jgi:hypothetical protein
LGSNLGTEQVCVDKDQMQLTRYAKVHLVEDYALNLNMVLVMQQLCCRGQAGMAFIGGLLSICNGTMEDGWTQIKEEIGKAQILFGKQIINDNIRHEKDLSMTDEKGRSKCSIEINATWNNHGSGKSYNSDSGHHLMVGNRSKKVVLLHYMSKHCNKCEK